MNTRTNEATLAGIGRIKEETTAETLRYAQNALLSELPGAVFAFLTLAYVVSSLIGLA